MTAIDSVALYGKLWINEDDMRTHLIDVKHDLPKWLSEEGFGKHARDLMETLACPTPYAPDVSFIVDEMSRI